jgi:hypothetical protein
LLGSHPLGTARAKELHEGPPLNTSQEVQAANFVVFQRVVRGCLRLGSGGQGGGAVSVGVSAPGGPGPAHGPRVHVHPTVHRAGGPGGAACCRPAAAAPRLRGPAAQQRRRRRRRVQSGSLRVWQAGGGIPCTAARFCVAVESLVLVLGLHTPPLVCSRISSSAWNDLLWYWSMGHRRSPLQRCAQPYPGQSVACIN